MFGNAQTMIKNIQVYRLYPRYKWINEYHYKNPSQIAEFVLFLLCVGIIEMALISHYR
jgi:hypothetical protein